MHASGDWSRGALAPFESEEEKNQALDLKRPWSREIIEHQKCLTLSQTAASTAPHNVQSFSA